MKFRKAFVKRDMPRRSTKYNTNNYLMVMYVCPFELKTRLSLCQKIEDYTIQLRRINLTGIPLVQHIEIVRQQSSKEWFLTSQK